MTRKPTKEDALHDFIDKVNCRRDKFLLWPETSKAWRDLDIGRWADDMKPLGKPYQSIMDENTEDLYES